MFERYAIFYTPNGALANFGAAWLGWDSAQGRAVPHISVAGIDTAKVAAKPRKYGLHGTLKAPFRLTNGATQNALGAAMAEFAGNTAPCDIGTLSLGQRNGFVALRPAQEFQRLTDFAAQIVTAFDAFRSQLTQGDIARRRRARLSARQDNQLQEWGYPFIFEDFNFHMTLSGTLPPATADLVIAALHPKIMPLVRDPFMLDAITLMGEDGDGLFHQIHRYALTGLARSRLI